MRLFNVAIGFILLLVCLQATPASADNDDLSGNPHYREALTSWRAMPQKWIDIKTLPKVVTLGKNAASVPCAISSLAAEAISDAFVDGHPSRFAVYEALSLSNAPGTRAQILGGAENRWGREIRVRVLDGPNANKICLYAADLRGLFGVKK